MRLLLRSRIVRELTALAAIVTIFLVAYGRFLRGDKSLATSLDNTYFYLPLFRHISESFSRGDYPYWIPSLMGGLPLYDNANFSLVYPLYFFSAGFYQDAGAAILQLNAVIFLHLLVAYLNAYVLFRVLRLARLPAVVGASIFALSQNLFTYAIWVAIIAAYCWVPLALAGAILVLENRKPIAGICLLTFALTMVSLASPAHALIHAFVIIAVLTIFRVIRLVKTARRAEITRALKHFSMAGVATVLLSSPAVVPVLLHMKDMIRFASYDPPAIGFSRLTYQATLYGQLGITELAGAIFPYEVSSTIGHPYVGLAAISFAVLAVFRVRTHWVIAPLFLLASYALLSTTGSHLGLARLNYYVPLLNRFREPDRHLFVFVLGTCALAAFGFQYALDIGERGGRALLTYKHLLCFGVIALLTVLAAVARFPYVGLAPKWTIILASLAALTLPIMIPRKSGWRVLPACAAAALIIGTTAAFPKNVLEVAAGDFFTPANQRVRQTLLQLSQLDGSRNYRTIFSEPEMGEQKWAMNGTYYGVRSFYVYSNMLPYRQFNEIYLAQFQPAQHSLMLGARYYLCSKCSPPAGYGYAQSLNGYQLYVNDQALPRYWISTRVAGAYNSWPDFFNQVNAAEDIRAGIYVSEADQKLVSHWLAGSQTPIGVRLSEEGSSLNRIVLRAESDQRGMLILNEYYNGAWRATVNGTPAKVLSVNWNQVGVLLDRGSNRVEFEYHPTMYLVCLWIQRAAIILCLGYGLFQVYRLSRRRGAT